MPFTPCPANPFNNLQPNYLTPPLTLILKGIPPAGGRPFSISTGAKSVNTSQAKLEANRANAQHSTGPKTGEGKARSAQNSFKHGFTAKHLIIAEDEQETFDALHEGLRTELRPKGCLEETLFAQLLHAAWTLHRIKEMEANLFLKGEIDDPAVGKTLDRIMRYQRLHTANYHKALKALTGQQTRRLTIERIGQDLMLTPTDFLPIAADPDKVQRAVRRAWEAAKEARRVFSPAAPPA